MSEKRVFLPSTISDRSDYIFNREVPACLENRILIGAERQIKSGEAAREVKASGPAIATTPQRNAFADWQIPPAAPQRIYRIYRRRNGSRRYETTNYNPKSCAYVRGFSNGRLTRTFPLDSRPPRFPGPPARFSRGIIRARNADATAAAAALGHSLYGCYRRDRYGSSISLSVVPFSRSISLAFSLTRPNKRTYQRKFRTSGDVAQRD